MLIRRPDSSELDIQPVAIAGVGSYRQYTVDFAVPALPLQYGYFAQQYQQAYVWAQASGGDPSNPYHETRFDNFSLRELGP